MDVYALALSHPDYFEKAEKYFNNSVRYNGSRPYLAEARILHFRIKKENVDLLLSDLKNHYKEGKMEGKSRKWNSLLPLKKFLAKMFGINPVDMSKIKKSGKRIPNVPWMYILPLGTTEDFHNAHTGEEEL